MGPAIVLLLASVLSSFATDPVAELWEGQHDLTEKRLASVMQHRQFLDQRARTEAEEFLRKVKNVKDGIELFLLATVYPRAFNSKQAHDAYKQARARMVEQGTEYQPWMEDMTSRERYEWVSEQAQILADSITTAREEDRTEREKLSAELDKIYQESGEQTQAIQEYSHRRKVLRNQQQTMAQQSKARAPSDEHPSSETVSGFDHSGNFYHGSLGPSGTFSGFRQGPSGSSIISGNFDHNGGFVLPH